MDDSGMTSAGSTCASGSTDATSAPSVYSYSSSRDGRNLLREVAGRTLNAQNELYLLPADEGEHSRLDKQHLVHLLSVGRLYIAIDEVEEALRPVPGEYKAILDLGCGGGIWTTSMAQEFPHAQVVGVDLAPSTSRPPPDNCRFEFDDFTLGLEHYHGIFDLVHSRAVANGVKNFQSYIIEIAQCLKPGGVLIIIEGNFELMNEHKQPQALAYGDGAPGESWLARIHFEAYNSMKTRGSQVDAGMMLERWMQECELLYDVKYDVKWIPVGPWETGTDPADTQIKQMLGTLMRQNLKEFARSLVPTFLANGYVPEQVDRWVAGAHRELDNLDVKMYLRYHHCWARRKPDAFVGSSPLSPGPSFSQMTDESMELDEDARSTISSNSSAPAHKEGSVVNSEGTKPAPSLSPGPRAVPVIWKPDPETGEMILDTESLSGSMRSRGTASMSMSSGGR